MQYNGETPKFILGHLEAVGLWLNGLSFLRGQFSQLKKYVLCSSFQIFMSAINK